MSILNKENIFLIEIMVDHLKLEKKGKIDFNLINAENCVEFQFLTIDPMYVMDESFMQAKPGQTSQACRGCGNVKNGNSSLFALTSEQIKKAKKKLDLNVGVFKLLPERNPDRVSMGSCAVSLQELFSQLVGDSDIIGIPCSKSLKEPFKFFDTMDEFAGVVCLYIRMSCYGKVIITSFQMDLLGDSIEFQGNEGNRHYKFNRKNELTPNLDANGCYCSGKDTLPSEVPCSLEYGLKNAEAIRKYLQEHDFLGNRMKSNGKMRYSKGNNKDMFEKGKERQNGTAGNSNKSQGGGGGNDGSEPPNERGKKNDKTIGKDGGGGYGKNDQRSGKGGSSNKGGNNDKTTGRGGKLNEKEGKNGKNNDKTSARNGSVYGVNGQSTLSEAALAKKKADELKKKLCRDRRALYSLGGGYIMPDKFVSKTCETKDPSPCPCSCYCNNPCPPTFLEPKCWT